MTPRTLARSMHAMLQTRSQTLSFQGTVMDASSDDGYCTIRLDQGGIRHARCKPGAVSYGARVTVSRQAIQDRLTVVSIL